MRTKEKCHAVPLPGAPTVGVLTRQILILGEVGAGRRSVGGSVAHPDGEGRRRSRTPLGGTRPAVDDGTGAADAEARDDEAMAPLAATLSRNMATSTHVGELRCAARRCSARACRECWPERLLRRAGEVGVSGLRLGEMNSMR